MSSTFTFLDAKLNYSVPNSVVLTLERNSVSFDDYTLTNNQSAVAKALDQLPQSGALYETVVSLSGDKVAQSMDAMSGELYASTKSVLQSSARTVSSLPLKYLRTNLLMGQGREAAQVQVAGVDGVSALSGSSVKPVWAEPVGQWQLCANQVNDHGAVYRWGRRCR